MKPIIRAGLCLMAILASGAVATASASALGGPLWLVKNKGVQEKMTSTAAKLQVETTKTPEEFHISTTIKGSAVTTACKAHVISGATIIGGIPGTTKGKSEFKECKIEGIGGSVCKIESITGVAETIGPFNVTGTLVFPESVRATALVRFLPESGETFVSFKITGSLCPSAGEAHAKGCVAAEMWQAGKVSSSGALATENELNFPKTPIEKYEIWNGSKFVVGAACKMTIQLGTETPQAAAEIGRLAFAFTAAEKTKGFETAGWIVE